MTFLPTGKIHSDWCWCECVSRTSPLRALLSRPMSLDGSNPGPDPFTIDSLRSLLGVLTRQSIRLGKQLLA
ncbi:hypothetical protein Bca52824_038109 [Brassica carinata]|uniref:Uncharacterized protein n=1 Tax=Brassica carinata TaxID=52824 RepID=A0A8X7RNM4_BRACI|nr:hypothetical protein Bca52824_038109 [Brassica carinata]